MLWVAEMWLEGCDDMGCWIWILMRIPGMDIENSTKMCLALRSPEWSWQLGLPRINEIL